MIRRIRVFVARGVGEMRQSVELVRMLRALSEESEADLAAFRTEKHDGRRRETHPPA